MTVEAKSVVFLGITPGFTAKHVGFIGIIDNAGQIRKAFGSIERTGAAIPTIALAGAAIPTINKTGAAIPSIERVGSADGDIDRVGSADGKITRC